MKKFAALLLSRQALRPNGTTLWVRACVDAVNWLKAEGLGLVSSTGMQTWELLTALASKERLPLKLLLPLTSDKELIVARTTCLLHFALGRDRVEFIPVTGADSRIELMVRRDAAVVRSADLLLPVSVRGDGGMVGLIAEAENAGREVDRRFEVPYDPGHEALKVEVDLQALRPELESFSEDYLIHWTRAAGHAWPDERLITYYSDIVNSATWPRSGLDTLKRIVAAGRLIASTRHMPGRTATVSFSALRPVEAIPLMRWRARYGQMTFEPYGIGLRRDLAEKYGVGAVNYYDRHGAPSIDPNEAWRWQSRGTIGDWTAEREYRCKGDLSLRVFPEDGVVLFCRTEEEARELRDLFSFRVIPFFGN